MHSKPWLKRSRSKEISFSQRLSHNVSLTTSVLQCLSHNVFLTPLPLHIRPHNVVLTTSQYARNVSVLYTNLKISHICLSSDPRTEASYQSAADKVLHKHPRISQNRPSSNPRNFDNFWSIKLKPRRCTPAIYILSLWEVSEP